MDEAHEIPTNIEDLTRLVVEQRITLKAKDFEIEHLRLRVARLRRLKFGQSSERFMGEVEQLTLLGGTGSMPARPRLDETVVQAVVEGRIINELYL